MEIEAIKKILDIQKNVWLSPKEMAENLSVTFYPTENKDEGIKNFCKQLEKTFVELGVKIIPFEDALVELSLKQKIKRFFSAFLVGIRPSLGKKIKKGIAIIVEGESKTEDLAMSKLISLRENPIITIIREPKEINKNSSYLEHMASSLNLFAFHMTNLAITVNDSEWAIYSLNGSHPYFSISEDFSKNVLGELIPKISAPVMPPSLKEFLIREGKFDTADNFYKPFLDDLIEGGSLLEKTGLYPQKRLVSELNFRNNLYRWIGSRYLDKRNGMSYGFVARQLPAKMHPIILKKEFEKKIGREIGEEILIEYNKKLFLRFDLLKADFFVEIPDVWVLTSKSGSDKSHLDKKKDIVKMGLVAGKMIIETPVGVNIKGDYKPSFDTRVILAHSVGNAILASIIKSFRPNWKLADELEEKGLAIAHWHSYIKENFIPEEMVVYGKNNPSVSCSSPQSAIYAFRDKIKKCLESIENDQEYVSEMHIEPHHGANIIYSSIISLANYLLSNKEISKLE